MTVAPVTPRPVTAPCVIRPVRSDDETPLLTVYLAAFADNQAFCDYTDEKMHDAARRDLRESFTGRRAPRWRRHASRWPPTCRMPPRGSRFAVARPGVRASARPTLHSPHAHRRGLATALVASAMNALHQAGEQTLTSVYQLANPTSQTWHRAFGFVELPDLRYAQAYYRCARQELFRHEQQGHSLRRHAPHSRPRWRCGMPVSRSWSAWRRSRATTPSFRTGRETVQSGARVHQTERSKSIHGFAITAMECQYDSARGLRMLAVDLDAHAFNRFRLFAICLFVVVNEIAALGDPGA